jgi:hypothetical protein
LLEHRAALFEHLRQRWEDLFKVKFEVLLYDLTSTYFEGNPPFPEGDKRRYGHSRDKRSDCVQALLALPWQTVREGVQVKLLPQEKELYVLARSTDRVNKERAMRQRQIKGLVKRLKELRQMELKRDQLLLKLGAAKALFPAVWRLVDIQTPKEKEPVTPQTFSFKLRMEKLRQVRRREGRYLLRSNLSAQDPARKIRGHPNARRAFSNHRRSGIGIPTIHPAGERP